MNDQRTILLIPANDLPGTLRKRLTVPESELALLVEGEEPVGQRGPGEHRLGNWPRPAPDVVLLPQTPFDLRPRIRHLRSGDRQSLDLVWPLTLQVQDPARFYTCWVVSRPNSSTVLIDLEDHLAGLLWEKAQEQVVQYTLEDLNNESQIQSSLGGNMRSTLTAALSDLGLMLVGSQRPGPRTVDEEWATLESMNQIARLARDARFEAIFERLQDKEMLEYRLKELAAQQGENPPDEALSNLLWEEVDRGPEEMAIRARQAARSLERQMASMRVTLEGERNANERRFRQLMTRLEKGEKKVGEAGALTSTSARVLWYVTWVLRLAGYGLTIVSGLLACLVPYLYEEWLPYRGGILIFTGAVGVLTLLLDLWVQHLRTRARQQAIQNKQRESGASLKRRQEADQLVRARVEAGLKQVADSLDAAWKKGYALGGAARDLAVDLREVARQAARFGEQEVHLANYHTGRYLAQNGVPDSQLAAVLDLDEDLLFRSKSLARTAEALYEQINAEQPESARDALRNIENGLNVLRNRFTERGAYLMKSVWTGS